MPESTCPKCSGHLKEGFVLDHADKSRAQASWVEGTPERSFWTGLKLGGRTRLPIKTYRCSRCGFLESYAVAPS